MRKSLNLTNCPKAEGDTVFIETGPYKNAIGTVMRVTPKKMEIYLHDREYNGKAVMLNQSSGWVINTYTSAWVKEQRLGAHRPTPQPSKPSHHQKPPVTPPSGKPHRLDDTATCKLLEADIAEMQRKLEVMTLVVQELKGRANTQNTPAPNQGETG